MSTTFTAHYTVVGKLTLFWALLLQLITNYCTPTIVHQLLYTNYYTPTIVHLQLLYINYCTPPTIVHQLLYTSNYCIAIRKQILNWRYTQKSDFMTFKYLHETEQICLGRSVLIINSLHQHQALVWSSDAD